MIEVIILPTFDKSSKRLIKKYKSLSSEITGLPLVCNEGFMVLSLQLSSSFITKLFEH
jgi:hypothetical protein